jgi:hypothetical protein
VIFYDFDGEIRQGTKSSWDSKLMGNDSDVSYGYMVGYISKDGKYRLNIDKKAFGKRDGEQVNWDYVEHTDERELFFAAIFLKFKDLLSKLSNFKNKITPKSIDEMIKNGVKLLN